MIDRIGTSLQESIIYKANSYLYKDIKFHTPSQEQAALACWENKLAMSGAIVLTSAIDYIKIPLAAIEETMKGILLTPLAPFHSEMAERCFTHYAHGLHYLSLLLPHKILFKTISDIFALKISLKSPHIIPFSVYPSYYGGKGILSYGNPNETNYPSLYRA